jgi:hypothetical protein
MTRLWIRGTALAASVALGIFLLVFPSYAAASSQAQVSVSI